MESLFEASIKRYEHLMTILSARKEELPAGEEDREPEPLAGIGTLDNTRREREQGVEETKGGIQELGQRLEASVTEDLERILRSLEREKSDLDSEHRKTLDQLSIRYSAELSKARKKNEELARTNRSQEQEIKALRNSSTKLQADLEKQVTQLNKFTGKIVRKTQRVNTSAIRDDEYFEREFAGLATDIRNWSFSHFPSHSGTEATTSNLWGAIEEIASGAYLFETSENRAATRLLIVGLLASQLKKQLFDPPLLGLLPPELIEFENVILKSSVQKSQWLSQTISLLVESERFEQMWCEKVRTLSRDLGEMLGGLAVQESSESKTSKRNKKLFTIVERAARIAAEVSQQPHWFRFLAIHPGELFSPGHMEDVGGEVSLGEEDPCEDHRRVCLSVFPCVYRQEQVERGGTIDIVINKAWVAVEMRDSQKAIDKKEGSIIDWETKSGVACVGGCPDGCSEYREEPGAEGEGNEDSAPLRESAAGKAISRRSTAPGSLEDGTLSERRWRNFE